MNELLSYAIIQWTDKHTEFEHQVMCRRETVINDIANREKRSSSNVRDVATQGRVCVFIRIQFLQFFIKNIAVNSDLYSIFACKPSIRPLLVFLNMKVR